MDGIRMMMTRTQNIDGLVLGGAGVGAIVGLVTPDAFFWLFLILIGTNGLDWLLGRHAARALNEWNRTTSRNGLVSKGSQMAVLLVVRSLEAVAAIGVEQLPDFGLASSALALALIVEDLESIERHGIALGGKPIPGFSRVIRKLRTITGGERRHRRVAPPDGLERRRKDPDEEA